MSCKYCGADSPKNTGWRVGAWGPFCSNECSQAFRAERDKLHTDLREEPLDTLPENVSLADFELFALKIAVHAVPEMMPELDIQPQSWQRHPDLVAMLIKERLLAELPEEYVRTWTEGAGWARSSRYSFERPIPKDIVLRAARVIGVALDA